MKWFRMLFFWAVTLVAGCALFSRKSSDIPARRAFPVSQEIAPCTDFYRYACDPALDRFKLRSDRSRHILALHDSAERLLEEKKKYLSDLPERNPKSERATQLNQVYQACLNGEARAQEERQLVEVTQATLRKKSDRRSLLAFFGSRVPSPFYSLVAVGRIPNQDRSGWYDLQLETGGILSLPQRSYYENEALMADFTRLLEHFFKSLHYKNAKQRAQWVIDFETRFSKTYPLPEEQRQLYTQRTGISRKKMQREYPNLALGPILKKVPQKTHLRYLHPKSYAFLNAALGGFPIDQIKSLYLYKSLSFYMDDAYPSYYKKKFDFYHRYLGGPKTRPDREERCTRMVMRRFSRELDAELIQTLFPDFPKDKFEFLVEDVRKAMIRRLEKNTWLSPQGKKGALKKMNQVKMQLVRPNSDQEWDFNPKGRYEATTPIANLLELDRLRMQKRLDEFKKPRNRKRWQLNPLEVNAYYTPSDNQFVVLQGILQYPFYDPSLSREINLGAIGMVVGHELGHAIDDQGAKYDGQGRLKKWMLDKDIKQFRKYGSQLIDQYNQVGHNGELTLGENIGDITGLSFAYEAAFPENKGTLEQKKAFYLQYARLWCGKMRPAEMERRLKTDPHAQTRIRVNEPVKHQAGFYEAYQCTSKDAMYLPPAKRVRIW